MYIIFFFSSRRRHTRCLSDWSSDVCSSDLELVQQTNATGEISLVKNLGKVMFSDFLIPFEVTSLLLLAAMVGAVMLGKPEQIGRASCRERVESIEVVRCVKRRRVDGSRVVL